MEEYREYLDAGAEAPRLRPDRVHHRQGRAERAGGARPVAAPVQAGERAASRTGELNHAVQQILEERSPSTPQRPAGSSLYATQTDVAPPTIVLFVNNPDYLNETTSGS